MTQDELLDRIDRHLERADGHMARGNEIMAASNEIMRGHREYIREMTVRQERVTQQLVDRIDRGTAEFVAGRKVLEDVGLSIRQTNQALDHILDRLN